MESEKVQKSYLQKFYVNGEYTEMERTNVSPSYPRSGCDVWLLKDGRIVCDGRTFNSVEAAWKHSEMLYYSYN